MLNTINATTPAGWLLLVSLVGAGIFHILTHYLELKIREAIYTARSEVHRVDITYIAVKEREQLEICKSARKVCLLISPLLLAVWLLGLGRL